MAIDAFVDSQSLNNDLTSIADKIREKRNLSSSVKLTFPTDFVDEIANINPFIIGTRSTITDNGEYQASDDSLDGYSSITVNVHPGQLAPIDFDNDLGYVMNGAWIRGGDTVSYSDIYEIEADKNYLIMIGGTIGTRFRVMFTTVNINETEEARVSGTQIINTNNPKPYSNKGFTSVESGYVIIQKDNAGTAGLKSYLFDVSKLPNDST